MKIIPLRTNSKVPLCKKWQRNWDRQRMREKFLQFPDSNIGLLLGDIIDVEGDNEEANQLLFRIIGNYPHPSYSSTKSVHHLFINPDPDLSIRIFEKIEFRGHGHQSVLPPSKHYGVVYQWLGGKFPIPPMPLPLLRFYRKVKNGIRDTIKPGHTRIRCSRCGEMCFIHKRRLDLELIAFRMFEERWECQDCRSRDLRPLCRQIKRNQIVHT